MSNNSKEYMREYRRTHREAIQAGRAQWRKNHRKECNEYEYSKRDQHNARTLVAYHIKKGNLKKEPCEVCGCPDVQAHHDDYRYPLQVRWLCKQCHTDWHKNNSPIHGDRLDQRYFRRKGKLCQRMTRTKH